MELSDIDRRDLSDDGREPSAEVSPGPTDTPLVDWAITARRVGRSAVVLVALAVVAWVVRAAIVDAWTWSHLGNWLGLALGGIFVVELFVVGGSALRGMLRAGERGERLASHDVGLLPPLRRGRHQDPPEDRPGD
ncbi:hypothetical protein [Salsipaludibacter albus]|uniref:hypothetical protein n=1 Tax=Salsipaludibacter albus TaxID=2849650 RepID=UPI001EE3DC22|nr:hypothetical protein [Salsipaludibacter albus]MBY5164310.1 hypothetical protein [Salsipaludibacter albus]